jgi:predicted nucleic acid-binding protein
MENYILLTFACALFLLMAFYRPSERSRVKRARKYANRHKVSVSDAYIIQNAKKHRV